MALQYNQLQNAQYYVTKWMSSVPVNLAMVMLAAIAVAQFQSVIQLVDKYINIMAVAFAVWLVWQNYKWGQWASELIKSVGQIEITSQVVATRANMTEFS